MSEPQKQYNNNRRVEELYDRKPPDKRSFMRKGMDTFGNIFGLNVCFIIFSLPIFTIGASFTALYSMCIRIQEDKEETILSGYITEFKKNFKQATAAFFIIILYIVIMLGEYIMINNISGVISTIYTYILIVEAVLFCLVVPFVFPLIACYENTLINTFKNAFLLSIGYFGSWIKIFIAWFAPVAFCVIYPMIFLYIWYLWLLLIFGAIAYGTSYTIRRIFKLNKEAGEKSAEEDDEDDEIDENEDKDNNENI